MRYCKGAHTVFIVFAIDDRGSFDSLEMWIDEVKSKAEEGILKVVLGNKIERTDRKVMQSEGEAFAKKHQALYVETSAMEDKNVKEAFSSIAELLMKRQKTRGEE